jgi:hypothetical protein
MQWCKIVITFFIFVRVFAIDIVSEMRKNYGNPYDPSDDTVSVYDLNDESILKDVAKGMAKVYRMQRDEQEDESHLGGFDQEICSGCGNVLELTKDVLEIVKKIPQDTLTYDKTKLEIGKLQAMYTLTKVVDDNGKVSCIESPNVFQDYKFTELAHDEELSVVFSEETVRSFKSAYFEDKSGELTTVWLRDTSGDKSRVVKVVTDKDGNSKASFYRIIKKGSEDVATAEPNDGIKGQQKGSKQSKDKSQGKDGRKRYRLGYFYDSDQVEKERIAKEEETYQFQLQTLGKEKADLLRKQRQEALAQKRKEEGEEENNKKGEYFKFKIGAEYEYDKDNIPKNLTVIHLDSVENISTYKIKTEVIVDAKKQEASTSLMNDDGKTTLARILVDKKGITHVTSVYGIQLPEKYHLTGELTVSSDESQKYSTQLTNGGKYPVLESSYTVSKEDERTVKVNKKFYTGKDSLLVVEYTNVQGSDYKSRDGDSYSIKYSYRF